MLAKHRLVPINAMHYTLLSFLLDLSPYLLHGLDARGEFSSKEVNVEYHHCL